MSDNRFKEMVSRIIKTSDLTIEGGRLGKSLVEEVNRDEPRKSEFIKKFNHAWAQFKSRYGKHVVSPYIEWAGPSIIKNFLSYVLSFDENKIISACKKKGTNVDALLQVEYSFSKQDLEVIQNELNSYKVNVEVNEAAKMILSNSMKTLPILLNEILEIKYRMYTAAINIENLAGDGLKIAINYDGRIG